MRQASRLLVITLVLLCSEGHLCAQGPDHDIVTLKYSSEGALLWTAAYNGPGDNIDRSTGVAANDQGSVYVTGACYGTTAMEDALVLKYGADGTELWAARYDEGTNEYIRNLTLDSMGNIYVTAGSDVSAMTLKYTQDGTALWLGRYWTGYYGAMEDVCLDDSGNVYVVGTTVQEDDEWSSDIIVIKYTSDGSPVWIRTFNGTASGMDNGRCLALDGQGNLYVGGDSDGGATSTDYILFKYTTNGDSVWLRRYNGPVSGGESLPRISVDSGGYVVVTGRGEGQDTNMDIVTVKYAPDGSEQWSARYNGTANGNDVASDIAIDDSGFVYVTGFTQTTVNHDMVTIKYTPDGTCLWVKDYNGPGDGFDGSVAMVIDTTGNIVVLGESLGLGTQDDLVLIKYNPNGEISWLARYDGATSGEDIPRGMAIDHDGNIYVTGSCAGGAVSIVDPVKLGVPARYALHQNHPNPFNPVSTIRYELPQAGEILLVVYDILGREVTRLVDGYMEPGYHQVQWNGLEFASGIYIVRLVAAEYSKSIKMVLMK